MPRLTDFCTPYWYLVLVRILLVFTPQTGFIHPDEFFQSIEVLIGKFLDVECSPPWEFNSTFPIRSMVVPYFTIGMGYKFINGLNMISNQFFRRPILSPYLLIVTPRLIMCLYSFIVDFTLYKICLNNNEKCKSRLIVLASSYVTIVYATRTFSNSFELVLYSILLFLVCESLTYSNIINRRREYLNYRYEQSESVAERVRIHKLRRFLVPDSFHNCLVISMITVLGFFNRPTFLAFAVIPIFFWLYRGIGTRSITILQFHFRMLLFVLYAIPTVVFCVLVDSFYYGYITWGEIGMLDISINNFVVTPLNFVKYNMKAENLAVHGLHPRYLHALVNVPLLFNVLGICVAYSLTRYIYICFKRRFHTLPSVRSVRCLMMLAFISPIALLSMFPHQEPRFLIPVLLPLVYLHGNTILPEPDDALVQAPKIQPKKQQSTTPTPTPPPRPSYNFFKIWVLANTLLTIFYGFIHQGGVYQVTNHIYKELERTHVSTEFHIITSHIYSLPESFFMQKPSNKLYRRGGSQYSFNRRVFLYEEGSKDVDYIFGRMHAIIYTSRLGSNNKVKKSKVYLAISSSLDSKLHSSRHRKYFTLNLLEIFYPHISIEAFPDLTRYCLDLTSFFHTQNCTRISYDQYFTKVVQSLRLNLYEVFLNDM